MTTATLPKAAPLDSACAAAVDLARAAAMEIAGGSVGDHLGVTSEGDRIATHHFASLEKGYVGWQWSVTVARASRSKIVTVDEVGLLPGDEALLPPPWVPWNERLRPGDLSVGDLLPTAPDDERLVPAHAAAPEDDEDFVLEVFWELALGRPRVLSRDGRDDAVERWYAGDAGPDAPMAKAAPGPCGTCGFFLPLAGALRTAFGACANVFVPDDGRVVAVDHGCGGHSEALPAAVPEEPLAATGDDYTFEVKEVTPTPHGQGTVTDAEPAEPFGHS